MLKLKKKSNKTFAEAFAGVKGIAPPDDMAGKKVKKNPFGKGKK